MTSEYKKFNPLNVSSKFAICGLPIRVDTYKNCTFGCKYCFANCRKVMEFGKDFQIGNIKQVERLLHKIFDLGKINKENLLEVLISQRITWHCGGMSDPFQPIEGELHITKQLIDLSNKYEIPILFSTKSDTVYDCEINPKLHTFQLSVTNIYDRTYIEPNVPSINSRYKFYKDLKNKSFKVGIRIQPFLPNITDLELVKMFGDADNFTLEGIKIVPQNKEHKEYILNILGLNKDCFTQMGLLNLKPSIRLEMYKPFIDYFNEHNIPFSIADNDLHYIGTNKCCCGDRLVSKSTDFNNTAMLKKYGRNYTIENIKEKLGDCANCKCNHLFTSNRQEGCRTVLEFYNKRFDRKTSPFSPKFQYYIDEENKIDLSCLD